MLMLRLFNHIISDAPHYEDNDLVGFPINAILDWPMGTPAGLAMFTDQRVNAQFRQMFYAWSTYLVSPESRSVLPNGWLSAIPDIATTYQCDPTQEFYGFKNWDDFFTRLFRPEARQIPDVPNSIIINACESTPYRIARDIQTDQEFWLKGEPYSLRHMLNFDSVVDQFIGGSIYQAFLSALSYHRWHCPVDGTIVRTEVVPGTYYAESPVTGFDSDDGPDPAGPNNSQGFITSIAARALIYIQADNADIGLMCFMGVGMAEVSTCEITVKTGQAVKKGDELGMFHFGGSTHCLIFRPQTKIRFTTDEYPEGENIKLYNPIATVGEGISDVGVLQKLGNSMSCDDLCHCSSFL